MTTEEILNLIQSAVANLERAHYIIDPTAADPGPPWRGDVDTLLTRARDQAKEARREYKRLARD
jgi:hypothetical protein